MSPIRTFHNAYEAHYHIVFPVKYRKALLNEEITQTIVEISEEISMRYDIEFNSIGTDQNHIHLLLSFPPKYGGSDVVRIFKSITAKELFKKHPGLKKELWGGQLWSDGFYLATVSKRGSWRVVEQYVKKQGTKKEVEQLRLIK